MINRERERERLKKIGSYTEKQQEKVKFYKILCKGMWTLLTRKNVIKLLLLRRFFLSEV